MEPLLLERSAVLGPQKMHVLNSLAGGVAHDINNVLTAILGYGALAQKRAAEGSCVRRCIDNIMQAGVRAQAIVDGMLEFSRSNVMELVPVNVQSVVEETVELLVAALPSGVRLYRQFYAGDAAVLANPTQLHRLVMNLCMNAVQAMVNGGVLEVLLEQVEVADSRTLSHGELTAGRYVRLAVCDTGVGINPRVLDRIFDPLFTTRSS